MKNKKLYLGEYAHLVGAHHNYSQQEILILYDFLLQYFLFTESKPYMLIGDVEYENPDQIQSWIADIFFFEPFEQGLEKADDVKVLVEIQTELQTFLTDKVKQLQGE